MGVRSVAGTALTDTWPVFLQAFGFRAHIGEMSPEPLTLLARQCMSRFSWMSPTSGPTEETGSETT